MKNGKSVGILLLVASVVWGIVIWRVAGALGNRKKEEAGPVSRPSPVVTASDSIQADYPDPFLKPERGTEAGRAYGLHPSAFFSSGVISSSAGPPDFLFRGRLKQGKREYVLLESAGRQEIVEKGKVVRGFRIVGTAGDSAVLVKGNRRYILKR